MCSLKVFEEELTKYKLTDELGIVPGSLVFLNSISSCFLTGVMV